MDAWFNKKCKETERCKKSNPTLMHKKINEIIGKRACSASGCIKAKNGDFIIMDKTTILERWTEYIGDLFKDNSGEKPIITRNINGPKILKCLKCVRLQYVKDGKQ